MTNINGRNKKMVVTIGLIKRLEHLYQVILNEFLKVLENHLKK
jgi:hypothetical protein